jgi:hypothetical protein
LMVATPDGATDHVTVAPTGRLRIE